MTKPRYRECGVFIEVLGLNPQGLDSLLNAYKFFGKSSEEENSEQEIFEKVFDEVQTKPPGHLAADDLQILKDELPVEMVVKYSQCLLSFSKLASEGPKALAKSVTAPCIQTALDVLLYCEEFDPTEYHDAFIDMIDLYFEFGYLEKSTQLCERLYTSSSEADRPEILLRMGFLFGKLGDWKKEMEAYERVLKLNPENKKARFRLSEIYETNGLYQDALRVLKQPAPVKEPGTMTMRKLEGGRREGMTITDQLVLQKHHSDISFGMDNELDQDPIEGSEGDDRHSQSSGSDNPSLGKRTSSVNMGFDDLAREGTNTPAPAFPGRKNMKVEGLIKDINNEVEFNSKTRRRMVNIVELNEQFFINIQTNIEEMLSQFDLEKLLLDFKQCELGLKSSQGNSTEGLVWNPQTYASVDFKSIKKALKLELKKDSFKESIYQLLLNESKGRIRNTFQGAQVDIPEDFKKDLNNLFIFKRKKQTANPENSRIESWLKESKNKSRVARNLAQKLMSKMKTVPDFIGQTKFVDIVDSSIKILYQQKKYVLLSQICEILYKISKVFIGFPDFQVSFYNFGFLANCRIQNFEKAYIFFRVIGKNLIQEEHAEDKLPDVVGTDFKTNVSEQIDQSYANPLARLMQIAEENAKVVEKSAEILTQGPLSIKPILSSLTAPSLLFVAPAKPSMLTEPLDIESEKPKVLHSVETPPSKLREAFKKLYSSYSQSSLNLVCFTMINHLFNEFSTSSAAAGTQSNAGSVKSSAYHHRLFFQKFQKQFETGKQLKYYVNLISANNYIGSGSTGPAKECLLENGDVDTSPLTNFLLGFILLTESTNRNNDQKVESIHNAFEYFDKYKELSPPSKLPEVYYNLGRALSHLNMPQAALKMFAKNQAIVSDRLAEQRRLLVTAAKTLGKDVDWVRFEEHQHTFKIQQLYYESAFNQIVWQHKLHNTGLEFEVINSMFRV